MLNIDDNKPRFYISDLNNYNPEFLQEIIIWQNDKIKDLEMKSKMLEKNLIKNKINI